MNNDLEFLIYIIPLTFLALAVMYMFKLKKLKDSGKIPYIVAAREREILFFCLTVLSGLAILLMMQFHVFAQTAY